MQLSWTAARNAAALGLVLLTQNLIGAARAADKPQFEKFPDAVPVKDDFLKERALYDRRLNDLLMAAPDAFADAANRSGKPFVMHIGLDRAIIPGLEQVELRFEDDNRQSRTFSTSDLSRSRLRWLSFRFDKFPVGTKLFQVRLKYRGNGQSYDRWGVGTLIGMESSPAEAANDVGSPEAYFALSRNFRDLSQVMVSEIDFNKPFSEAPPTGQSQPDRGVEFFFFRPKHGLPKIGDTKTALVLPAPAGGSAAPAKTPKLIDQLKVLIGKQQYAIALDCLNVALASLQSRPFAQQVRLFVLRSLLESVTGDVAAAKLSIRHAEELFWSRSSPKPEAWDEASARVFFSLSLAKRDIERLKFL